MKKATTTGAGVAKRPAAGAGAVPVFYFPIYGTEAAKPVTEEVAKKQAKELREAIKLRWEDPGVKSLVTLLERKAAVAMMRGCHPGSDAHQQGQGFALQQVVAELQGIRWG